MKSATLAPVMAMLIRNGVAAPFVTVNRTGGVLVPSTGTLPEVALVGLMTGVERANPVSVALRPAPMLRMAERCPAAWGPKKRSTAQAALAARKEPFTGQVLDRKMKSAGWAPAMDMSMSTAAAEPLMTVNRRG